ncbi:MAG: hypothetical protein KBC22_00550 [Candidatus Pacebacteria bacterium]|nr:hypothetical protein [Candidatus Paceibacterota bacterium]
MQNFVTKYNIQNYFDKLPPANQQALLESNWEQTIWVIAKKSGLMLDETDTLVKEVGLVLLGVEPASNLTDNLVRNAGLLEKEVAVLIREINAVIFIPMRDNIKKLLTHPDRDNLLSEIEDKSKPQQATVTHKKLADIFSMAPAKSDYSVDKPVKPVSYEGSDPYHEPLD